MDSSILTLDGSQGEGGGQVLRSSLTLALVTGKAFAMEKIRAGRKKPGLMRQHLTAVAAAAEVGHAEVEGARLGSQRLTFRPGKIHAGDYVFRIGSAGSTTLVLQTVLPALMVAEGDSHLLIEGGTHNPMAPPVDFLRLAYLPLLDRLGPKVELQLICPGFYPAGGGQITVQVRPCRKLARLEIPERGKILARRVRAILSRLPRHIAQRECQTIAQSPGWHDAAFSVEEIAGARGPGNAVLIQIEGEHVTEVFSGIGKLGVPAEAVAQAALREANEYLAAGVPIGPHLADQLMLPLGIGAYLGAGGGAFRTMEPSLHSTTHLEILKRFLEVDAEASTTDDGAWRVRIG